MQPITTRIHGFLDYSMGALLIAAPWLFGFADVQPAMMVCVVLGAGAIVYSLLTDYELGAMPVIPMTVHLGLDAMSGLLLAASPWLFQFDDTVYLPHLILGLAEVGAAAMTQHAPARLRRHRKATTSH